MRYLPHTDKDIAAMLKAVGLASLEQLFDQVPQSQRMKEGLDLPKALDEWQLDRHMDKLASQMAVMPEYKVFMGAGSYDHHIPASVSHLLSRGEFTTAYTPYQPEVSQGTLQAIYEFQTLCGRLLGMDVVTASHYDGACALADAILIAIRKTGCKRVAISKLIHPLHRQVVSSYLRPMQAEIVELDWDKQGRTNFNNLGDDCFAAVVVQSPNFFGCIEDLAEAANCAKETGSLFMVHFTEPLAYGLLKAPGSFGADLVTGEGQSLGIARSFGGPGLGIVAGSSAMLRSLPGRLVGQTVDKNGQRGFVLTLATREQHIRREKATSNICSNNGLCAINAVMYLASLGGTGFKRLAQINHDKSQYLKEQFLKAGVEIPYSSPTFNEFVADLGKGFSKRYNKLLKKKIIAGLPLGQFYQGLESQYLFCVTEVMDKEDIDLLVSEVIK